MVNENCGECGRGINQDGCIPDKCLPGYRLFVDPISDPKKYCFCGKKLKRQPSHKPSKEYREIPLKCPDHGIIGYIEEEFRKKTPIK